MIVIDANILIRAVLGPRVLSLLRKYAGQVEFLTPDTAIGEAREHLPAILDRRGIPVAPAMELLEKLLVLVGTVEHEVYGDFESPARQRMAGRDQEDWPILAAALALQCPIWTEDTDFFGCGVATWTSDRVEVFLGSDSRESGLRPV